MIWCVLFLLSASLFEVFSNPSSLYMLNSNLRKEKDADLFIAHDRIYNNFLIIRLPKQEFFLSFRGLPSNSKLYRAQVNQHIEYCFFSCDYSVLTPLRYQILPVLSYEETSQDIKRTDFGQVMEDLRGNCEYWFPLARVQSGNVYFDYSLRSPFRSGLGYDVSNEVKIRLEPNQSVELLFDQSDFRNVSYRVIRTPEKMKKCESPEGLEDT
ncbi:MAG TPA: hypothetical protein PK453_27025, partial [Leptospiraceae bacterium]|nr:hypothetical protein [Leptospiraceae bacterium]